ncbi:hypothetical protein [Nocardia camponoti]|uniref:Uncharacterized protein n=1 Tax=Nocardia camponoti TaxID=1616106 RepID=A0A917QR11_9NOCA|nr:hypothetical protein [Nocardia camponoti]GGK64804.1 hypothetical protein GCM10011591_41300 [Nocardia camponoti]
MRKIRYVGVAAVLCALVAGCDGETSSGGVTALPPTTSQTAAPGVSVVTEPPGTTANPGGPANPETSGTVAPSTAPKPPEPSTTTTSPVVVPPGPATNVVSLVAVDNSGKAINGFSIVQPDPIGDIDCKYVAGSRSATTAGVVECGASAQAANVCWIAPDKASLLCADDPWQRGVRRWTVQAPPVAAAAQSANPEPWALELADGRHCRIRVGGAWGGRSDGLVGAYSCDGHDVVLQMPDAATAMNKSNPAWTVQVGELGAGAPDLPAPKTIQVRTAYFAAAS